MSAITEKKLSYFHREDTPPLLECCISQHFASVVARFPNNEAVVSVQQRRRLTYMQLAHEVDTLARGLVAMGFAKGNRIGIWSTNNIEWLLLQLATARIGAILVNINPAYCIGELAYALKKSKIEALFVIPRFRHSDYIAILNELLPALPNLPPDKLNSNEEFPFLRRIVVFDPADPLNTPRHIAGLTTWAEVIEASHQATVSDLDSIQLNCHDAINIQYTSGTTGYPKAVVLSHHNILNNAYFSALAMHFDEHGRLCVPVPFYHCFGMVLANLLCLSVGACIVIACEHFDAKAVLNAISNEKCTAIHGVPTMFIAELEHPDFEHFDLSSLRTGIMAGAPCPPALMQKVISQMHCPEILIGYGETEASPLTHLTTREDSLSRRTETVGRNLPHQEVKIVHIERGDTVPLGEEGEICFRGYHVMKGYYGDAKATHSVIDAKGWLHSGDIGSMDAEGYVRITGRIKEIIIRGGENIYPREIEALLFSHPKIADAAVFGIPDERYGEELMVWIQLHEKQSLSVLDIRNYCKDKIAHFKIPKYIRFVDTFPMTITGKLQKFRMREIVLAERQAKS
ncbi:fatty acid CoA ligase family protein [Pseudomonadota bacterium]